MTNSAQCKILKEKNLPHKNECSNIGPWGTIADFNIFLN